MELKRMTIAEAFSLYDEDHGEIETTPIENPAAVYESEEDEKRD